MQDLNNIKLPVSQTGSVSEQKQEGFANSRYVPLLVFMSFVVVILLIVSGFFIYKYLALQKEMLSDASKSATSPPIINPTSTVVSEESDSLLAAPTPTSILTSTSTTTPTPSLIF